MTLTDRYSLWKKISDALSYSKLVLYTMLNTLVLLIQALLHPAFQEIKSR